MKMSHTAVVALLLFVARYALAQDELVMVQVIHRHGAKVPQTMDPFRADLWDLPLDALIPQGAVQMRALGAYLRAQYVDFEDFLPAIFDQNLLFWASTPIERSLQSAESVAAALYPGAAIPIYSVEHQGYMYDTTGACPSLSSQWDRISQELSDEYLAANTEYFANLTQRSGWASEGIFPEPRLLNHWVQGNVENEVPAGFDVDPYFTANRQLMDGLYLNAYYAMYEDDAPPNAFLGNEVVQEFVEAVEASVEGTTPERLRVYSMHAPNQIQLGIAFGLRYPAIDIGCATVYEVRRTPAGIYTIEAYRAWPSNPGPGAPLYTRERFPMRCPNFQDVCPVAEWLEFVKERVGDNSGCCLRTQGFFDNGCDDFLNPEVVNTPACAGYREVCPAESCDINQVVDRATLQCRQRRQRRLI